jgi:hypothetical protein
MAGPAGESGKDTECLVKQVEVSDEHGKTWLIYKGDSAWNQCRFLAQSGVAEVVLPREMLLPGRFLSWCSIDIPEVPMELVRMLADVQAIVLRQIRLQDCVQWLTMNGVANGLWAFEEVALDKDTARLNS